jgi:hypothetical protein
MRLYRFFLYLRVRTLFRSRESIDAVYFIQSEMLYLIVFANKAIRSKYTVVRSLLFRGYRRIFIANTLKDYQGLHHEYGTQEGR